MQEDINNMSGMQENLLIIQWVLIISIKVVPIFESPNIAATARLRVCVCMCFCVWIWLIWLTDTLGQPLAPLGGVWISVVAGEQAAARQGVTFIADVLHGGSNCEAAACDHLPTVLHIPRVLACHDCSKTNSIMMMRRIISSNIIVADSGSSTIPVNKKIIFVALKENMCFCYIT